MDARGRRRRCDALGRVRDARLGHARHVRPAAPPALPAPDPPAPAFRPGPDQTVSEDALVTFDGTATGDNDPEFPTGASFRWTFEDGGALSLAGTVTTYTFRTPGTYWVRLTVTDAYGNAAP